MGWLVSGAPVAVGSVGWAPAMGWFVSGAPVAVGSVGWAPAMGWSVSGPSAAGVRQRETGIRDSSRPVSGVK